MGDFLLNCKYAIENLGGIESCSIWFNPSTSTPLVIKNKTIPIREAYIVIKGVDITGKIAETFYKYMNVPATVGSQSNTTRVGLQDMTVNYDLASGVTIPVYIHVKQEGALTGYTEILKQLIMNKSGMMDCGQNVTQQMISTWLQDNGYCEVIGAFVGDGDDITSSINPNSYVEFSEDSITIIPE